MNARDVTIRVSAARYEDEDDCLAAAAADVARERALEGWDLSPRWVDDRTEIELTIPAWAAAETEADRQARMKRFLDRLWGEEAQS